MGAAVILAAASLAVTAYSAVEQNKAAKEQAAAQKKVSEETTASNTARQMAERRQQIREERVKRARILASSEASGTTGSSGEIGAVGSLNTQLGSNVGSNQSAIQSGQRISVFQQQAADAQLDGQQAGALGSLANAAIGVGGSIFSSGVSSTSSSTSVFDASSEQKRLQK